MAPLAPLATPVCEWLVCIEQVKLYLAVTMCVLKLHAHHLSDCFNQQAPHRKGKTILLKNPVQLARVHFRTK